MRPTPTQRVPYEPPQGDEELDPVELVLVKTLARIIVKQILGEWAQRRDANANPAEGVRDGDQ